MKEQKTKGVKKREFKEWKQEMLSPGGTVQQANAKYQDVTKTSGVCSEN